jgi:hypothetical protein
LIARGGFPTRPGSPFLPLQKRFFIKNTVLPELLFNSYRQSFSMGGHLIMKKKTWLTFITLSVGVWLGNLQGAELGAGDAIVRPSVGVGFKSD